jgi:hypothetical protein
MSGLTIYGIARTRAFQKHSPGRLYPGTLEGEARAWQRSPWAVTEVTRRIARINRL